MNSTDATPVIDTLAHCSAEVRRGFLQLNADKSEVVLLGTAAQLRSVAAVTTDDVAGSILQVASQLKTLGVTVDSHLRFDIHVRNVARACNYRIRDLRHVQFTDERRRSDNPVQY